ncbi:maltose alpha-D-glucosyltransferase, partial [Myxococcota bacterium]
MMKPTPMPFEPTRTVPEVTGIHDDPFWYKDAVIYELHVRAFCDGDDDGKGDFRGLCSKLDYLQDLGVTAIWILPFYPSPLKDDGYDIADYYDVHPDYGSMADFDTFLEEAHRRGLRVITELVVNHTSSEHEWFKRARQAAPGTPERDFYVWSETTERYKDARIIFKDFETSNWARDPVANAYYWHRFYSSQPDLNYDNPQVQKAVLEALDFWLAKGVDGLRLDAIPYLFQREGTNCENLPETHEFLKKLRRHIDKGFRQRMLLAEANQWPEDSVAYFGEGDECHMAFHFPVMPRLFMAVQLEDRFPILDILQQTPPIPKSCQWAMFLRNHDELTLEMVTDEERDYMYGVYASDPQARINLGIRRRLAPLLGNRRKVELLNGLLFSMPGTPVLYYGDEIGMGDNIFLGDRNGVRTPMQWSSDRNAGFSRANPQRLYQPVIVDPEYHYESVNVETQQSNPESLLWWMKRLIALRKQFKAFGRGSIEFLRPVNNKVLVYVRSYHKERILVVANLSRFVQHVSLDLAEFEGMIPVELFGRTQFPTIGRQPYSLSLSPHTFFWFALEPSREVTTAPRSRPHRLKMTGPWTNIFAETRRKFLESRLPGFLQRCRWFGGKGKKIVGVRIKDVARFEYGPRVACMTVVDIKYEDQRVETYMVPLAFAGGSRAAETSDRGHVVMELEFKKGEEDTATGAGEDADRGVIYDAVHDPDFCAALVAAIGKGATFGAQQGRICMEPTDLFSRFAEFADHRAEVNQADQSNTSVRFGDLLFLKLFRRAEEGPSLDYEVGRHLSERQGFCHVPPIAGIAEYRQRRAKPVTIALLQGYVANEGDAWQLTLSDLVRFYERVLVEPRATDLPMPPPDLSGRLKAEISELAADRIGPYLKKVQLLGLRTAQMHAALTGDDKDPLFAPEPFSPMD